MFPRMIIECPASDTVDVEYLSNPPSNAGFDIPCVEMTGGASRHRLRGGPSGVDGVRVSAGIHPRRAGAVGEFCF